MKHYYYCRWFRATPSTGRPSSLVEEEEALDEDGDGGVEASSGRRRRPEAK